MYLFKCKQQHAREDKSKLADTIASGKNDSNYTAKRIANHQNTNAASAALRRGKPKMRE